MKQRFDALAPPVLLGLDVDGTLAPIVDRPEDAAVPDETQRILRKLAKAEGLIVALVTGRDLRALRAMARVPGAWRAVEHGGHIVAPGERASRRSMTADETRRVEGFVHWAEGAIAEPGSDARLSLERKARSVALHTRGSSSSESQRWLEEAKRAARRFALNAREGRAVLEAELDSADKGVALATLHERTGARSVFYAGDDLTDLPAIRYAKEHGIGVFVKSEERPQRPKQASFAVPGHQALAVFLGSLAESRAKVSKATLGK